MKKKSLLFSIIMIGTFSSFAQWNVNGTHLYNTNAGNVGIGTSSPVGKLHVYDQGKASALIIGNVNAGFSFLNIGTSADQNGYSYIESVKSSGGTYGNLVMNYNGGNVGIGTTTPTNRLEVSGSTFNRVSAIGTANVQSGFQVQRTGASFPTNWEMYVPASSTDLRFNNVSDRLTITTGGNVGIGTITPRGKLDVDGPGDIYLSDDLISGAPQSLYIPGHIYISPYPGQNISYLQARRSDTSGSSSLRLRTVNNGVVTEAIQIEGNGNVGIGTIDPKTFKLAVNGKVWATEVQVAVTVPGPDYVFEKDYDLPTLEEVKSYLETNKHLPEVPSACKMEEEGVNLSEMNMLLLKKVEELTLYMIQLQEKNQELEKRVKQIENK